jgi:RNA polymerase sigma-54 factor
MLAHRPLPDTKIIATAHLAQTMSYLQLSAVELEETLAHELDQNPALELVEEARCPGCGKRLIQAPCPTCAAPTGHGEPIVYLSPRQPRLYSSVDEDWLDAHEAYMAERLDEYILRQIGPQLTREERPIAAYILAQLDENGLLTEGPAEIAAFKRAPLGAVRGVLSLIQHADPPGVGAQTPAESLLIQLECLRDSAPASMLTLVGEILQSHFELLGKRDYAQIARRLRLPRASIETAARFIQRNLTPYPARAFWGEGKLPNLDSSGDWRLQDPDVSISLFSAKTAGEDPTSNSPLMVEVFTPFSGWLRVNPAFKAALAECDESDREKWSAAVEQAALITKCVQQRNHTMRRLMQMIATEQRDFILGGDGRLRPLTRAQVAKTLGVHESTVSRAVAGKTLSLPNGRIIPLSKFFDRSLSVRDRVRHLVEGETHPLTDDEIADALAQKGIRVARRTVAKYRNMLGILPANIRARLARARRVEPVGNLPGTLK